MPDDIKMPMYKLLLDDVDCKCQNRHSAISVLSFVLVGLKPKTLIETAIRRQMALGNKPQVWQLESLVSYTNYKFGISG